MKNILANVVVVLLMTQPVLAASPAVVPGQFDKKLPATTAPDTQTAQSSAQATSVLERFRTYSGPRTPGALAALFTDPVTATVRQHPTVALADGATMVRITIDAGSSESISPNVALNEAQLISLKHSKADKWAIEALPAAGTWNASLILLTGSDSKTVPLTVAPRLPAGTDLSEKGFVAFLGGTKASARPLLDLNDDGRRDYLDDYIFTANYLVGPGTAPAVPETAQISKAQDPGTTQKADIQDSDARLISELQGSESKNPASQESADGQGSAFQTSTPHAPQGATGEARPPIAASQAKTSAQAPVQTPAPVTEILPSSAPSIQLDTSPDRHNLVNRNERARKIKELLRPQTAN